MDDNRVRALVCGSEPGKDGGDFGIADAQEFVAGRLAPDDTNTGLSDSQPIGQEGPTGRVGGPLHRRNGQADANTLGALAVGFATGCHDLIA